MKIKKITIICIIFFLLLFVCLSSKTYATQGDNSGNYYEYISYYYTEVKQLIDIENVPYFVFVDNDTDVVYLLKCTFDKKNFKDCCIYYKPEENGKFASSKYLDGYNNQGGVDIYIFNQSNKKFEYDKQFNIDLFAIQNITPIISNFDIINGSKFKFDIFFLKSTVYQIQPITQINQILEIIKEILKIILPIGLIVFSEVLVVFLLKRFFSWVI